MMRSVCGAAVAWKTRNGSWIGVPAVRWPAGDRANSFRGRPCQSKWGVRSLVQLDPAFSPHGGQSSRLGWCCPGSRTQPGTMEELERM